MPAIWNVNQSYNSNNKKLTSKLTFSAGEKFRGKIIEKSAGNEIKVKLPDGWQFSAEVEGEAVFTEQDVVKFEVIGYENGKLKLKLIEGSVEGEEVSKDRLQNLVKKEGLENGDLDILKKMVEHDIPLTRDNIKFVKSLIQFNIRVNNDPEEVDNFISKFLESKNIDVNSAEAEQIKQVLKEFIDVFKGMSTKDVLLFLENNIEINKANIESYNKLFSGDVNLNSYFDGLAKQLKNMDLSSSSKEPSESIINPNIKKVVESSIEQNNNNNKLFATKVYDSIESAGGKINVLDILKSMANSELDEIKGTLNEIISNRMSDFSVSDYGKVTSNIKNLGDNELLNLINNSLGEDGVLDRSSINKVINNILGKEIVISDEEANKIIDEVKQFINNKVSDIENVKGEEVTLKDEFIKFFEAKGENSIGDKLNLIPNEKFNELIKGLSESTSEVTKEGLNKIISQLSNKDINLSQEEIDVFKKFLSLKQEIDIPNKANGRESIKDELVKGTLGIKESVKDIIKVIENTGLDNSKIVEFLKENINDFKLFNSINKEYYYLDVPINQQGKEYQCKLVIKDKRKDGKKIDRTNVKVVVSINTINLGKIDNYLSIRDSIINVDIKCNEEMVKILDKNKNNLANSLSKIGLLANVTVSKKIEEVSLTTCREFFNDSKLSIIDRTV